MQIHLIWSYAMTCLQWFLLHCRFYFILMLFYLLQYFKYVQFFKSKYLFLFLPIFVSNSNIEGRAFLEECLRTDSVSTQGAANVESSEGLTEDQTSSQNVNVLVTYGTLIPSLVKCLLFQLDGFITLENGEFGTPFLVSCTFCSFYLILNLCIYSKVWL